MVNIHTKSHAQSYYAATQKYTADYPQLTESITADICIVGGGFTGVATALEMAERGYNVVLLEGNKIAWGASGRNGGQMIRGIGHDLSAFKRAIGQQGIDTINNMAIEANEIIINRVKKYQIECDLTLGYCDLATKPKHLKALQEQYQQLKEDSYPYALRLLNQQQVQQEITNSSIYLGGLEDMGSGHLHPLNLCTGEAKIATDLGAKIFENSNVINLKFSDENIADGDADENFHTITTEKGQVKAKKLVLAGNAYLSNIDTKMKNKILPAGSYIIATEPLTDELAASLMPNNHAVCDQNIALDYFRLSADKRLLFGGMCNYSGRDPKDIKAVLYPKMLKVFPQLTGINIDFQWGGMIGIGANRLPQIGRINNNIFYAQAYSGHGVSASHVAARLIAEAMTGESNRIEVFEKVQHISFPGGKYLRSPLLALGMMYHKCIDMLS